MTAGTTGSRAAVATSWRQQLETGDRSTYDAPMPRRYVVTALVAAALGIGVFLHTVFDSDAWTNRARARADLEQLYLLAY